MRMQEDSQDVRDGQRRHGREGGGGNNNNGLTAAQSIPDDEPALDGYNR